MRWIISARAHERSADDHRSQNASHPIASFDGLREHQSDAVRIDDAELALAVKRGIEIDGESHIGGICRLTLEHGARSCKLALLQVGIEIVDAVRPKPQAGPLGLRTPAGGRWYKHD